VTNNGIYVMGLGAIATLMYTGGNITALVVMYSINVFLTFSLTILGMTRHTLASRSDSRWLKDLAIYGTGLVMCVSILAITLFEKFGEGGWITLFVTGSLVALFLGAGGSSLLPRRPFGNH
jgi:hypothetical protein